MIDIDRYLYEEKKFSSANKSNQKKIRNIVVID